MKHFLADQKELMIKDSQGTYYLNCTNITMIHYTADAVVVHFVGGGHVAFAMVDFKKSLGEELAGRIDYV